MEAFLGERFPQALLTLPAPSFCALLGNVAAAGMTGGAIYDALIAATVRHAGATLLTRDRRALATYDRIGVRYEVVE